MNRYPFSALANAMGLSENACGEALGVTGSQLQEYRARGVTERVADRLAIKAGKHPFEVWPDWLEDGVERQRAAYNDRKAAEVRRRYNTAPEVAEAKRAARRAQYAATSEYERARERARYWADPEAARAKRRDRYQRQKSANSGPDLHAGCD